MPLVPAGAEEFSFSRCMVTGSGSDWARSPSTSVDTRRFSNTPSDGLTCLKAGQEYEARRQAEAAAQRERQRRADEEAARQQMEAAAKEAADLAAAKEQSRAREEVERARKAEEVADAARQHRARQEAEYSQDAAPQPPRAGQFMPGPCVTADLTAKCAMPQDPVLEQIRKSQENAARGWPSR